MVLYTSLDELNGRIIDCRKCSRLVEYRDRYRDWDHWGRPLVGLGDLNARFLIVGLAPAAHGGNRTGRMFTGDSSGDWLIKVLYEIGLANQPYSKNRFCDFKCDAGYEYPSNARGHNF